jgi:hypothetical protein
MCWCRNRELLSPDQRVFGNEQGLAKITVWVPVALDPFGVGAIVDALYVDALYDVGIGG